ncbi:hypothetical protein [Streptosporangium sp. NPDC000396]|uniref:hypothetical protein n=1 Tax=Streptosporangium sp. NPDC000396 TaxID=3366185 RepID=UPI0036A9D4DA
MTGVLGKLGDRVLEKLVPKATAKADTYFYRTCYCDGINWYAKLCWVVGGQTGCLSSCENRGKC